MDVLIVLLMLALAGVSVWLVDAIDRLAEGRTK